MRLGIVDALKRARDRYVIRQAERAVLPEFEADAVIRRRVIFRGRVQKVGFRLEVLELAGRLELTGFCRNLENGDVLAELQGEANRIDWLVAFMERLKRVRIREKTVDELAVDPTETEFSKQ